MLVSFCVWLIPLENVIFSMMHITGQVRIVVQAVCHVKFIRSDEETESVFSICSDRIRRGPQPFHSFIILEQERER